MDIYHQLKYLLLYEENELRACVLLSLFIQIFLIFVGTFRRSSYKWIVILLWLAYLLADIVAVFGLGLVVSGNLEFCDVTCDATRTNECIAVAYCFYESQHFTNPLVIPTILILLCGIIKCLERVRALHYGSADSFRKSMHSKLDLDANMHKKLAKLLVTNRDALTNFEVLQYGFVFFETFKGVLVDLMLSIYTRNQSRGFFLATSYKEAFCLVEVELNYLYDVLFTKRPVLHHKFGYCCRILSFIALVASFALFHFVVTKDLNFGTNLVITYILLIGAIVLDVIQFFMLLSCDWTIVKLRPLSDANAKHWKHKFVDGILFVNKTINLIIDCLLGYLRGIDHRWESEPFYSRWFQSLSTFNLIFFCLHRYSKEREKILTYLGLASILNGMWYVKSRPLNDSMTNFIFNELRTKAEMASSIAMAKQICSSRGEWVLQIAGFDRFVRFVEIYNFDEILILWHIATELCYNDSQDQLTDNSEQRNTAKQLSDYMAYLLVMKPDMMSAVSTTGEKKFLNTCNEVSKLFKTKLPELKKRKCSFFGRESNEEMKTLQIKACETILSEPEPVLKETREAEPVLGETKEYKFLLFKASQLAKELKLLSSKDKWLVLSKLWVELLSYAASNIRSSAYAPQLYRGRELITVVWLLMAKFGLGDWYEVNPIIRINVTKMSLALPPLFVTTFVTVFLSITA